MRFIPTRAALRVMVDLDLSWADLLTDLSSPETVTPIHGFETRLRVCGRSLQAYVEPGTDDDGHRVMVIVGLRERVRSVEPVEAVVGVDAPGPGRSRRRGPSGSAWPSSWREVIARLEAMPGVLVQRGGKHWRVVHDGVCKSTLPVTSSDHRALRNACMHLRSVGLDVRR